MHWITLAAITLAAYLIARVHVRRKARKMLCSVCSGLGRVPAPQLAYPGKARPCHGCFGMRGVITPRA